MFASDGEVCAAVALIGPMEIDPAAHVPALRSCAGSVAHSVEVLEQRWYED